MRTWHALALGMAGVAAVAAHAAIDGDAPPPAAAAAEAGFVAQRCRLLGHDRHRLEVEAQRLADDELAPIFRRMDDRVDAFAEWAFRWRTSYALLRRSGLGALSAVSGGQSVPERLRAERDAFVEEAFLATVVLDEDKALQAASRRWRDRLRGAADEMDREHDTATALYLGFQPRLGGLPAHVELPSVADAPEAAGEARSFAMTRVARPLLVRVGARLTAALVPTSFVPQVLGETAVVPVAPVSVAALLGVDYLISRLDALVSRETFAADIRAALDASRLRLRETWSATGRAEIGRRIEQRRALLSTLAGPEGCR